MTFSDLLEWQWKDYADKHRNRNNLLIHIVAVPVFILAALNLVGSLMMFNLGSAVLALGLMGLALFAQGKGHAFESVPPEPFHDGWDFLRRVLAEQFITFPRFVLTGGWLRNLQAAA